jgi:integrase
VLDKYLLPRFGNFLLRDLTPAVLQQYFSVGMTAAHPTLGWESKNKIRDVLASVLKRAVRKYALLERNPMEAIELPPDKIGKRTKMPYLTPEQFDELVTAMPEPYATMVQVAIYTGLRISELVALRWQDVGSDSHRGRATLLSRRLVEAQKPGFERNHRGRPPGDRAHLSLAITRRRSRSRTWRRAPLPRCETGWAESRIGFSVGEGWETDAG